MSAGLERLAVVDRVPTLRREPIELAAAFAVGVGREVHVAELRAEVAVRHVLRRLGRAVFDLPKGAGDGGVLVGRRLGLGTQRELAGRLQTLALDGLGAGQQPHIAAGFVVVPNRHGERDVAVVDAEHTHVQVGEERLTFFLGHLHRHGRQSGRTNPSRQPRG